MDFFPLNFFFSYFSPNYFYFNILVTWFNILFAFSCFYILNLFGNILHVAEAKGSVQSRWQIRRDISMFLVWSPRPRPLCLLWHVCAAPHREDGEPCKNKPATDRDSQTLTAHISAADVDKKGLKWKTWQEQFDIKDDFL